MFGKKGTATPPPLAPQDGRAWVDKNLARYDQPGSNEFARALGLKLFDSTYQAMKDERGVRVEAIVAMLSSVAGQLCLAVILEELPRHGLQPADIGMLVVDGADGHRYFFGDAPNRLLCEDHLSFISLVFGAAHEHGGRVSIEMMNEELKIVAQRVGTDRFLELDLPPQNAVDSPLEWARHFSPFVVNTIGAHFRAAVANAPIPVPSTVGAPPFQWPRILGFAVQKAIDEGHQALDPTILARIAMGCALRTAKLDPQWVRAGSASQAA